MFSSEVADLVAEQYQTMQATLTPHDHTGSMVLSRSTGANRKVQTFAFEFTNSSHKKNRQRKGDKNEMHTTFEHSRSRHYSC